MVVVVVLVLVMVLVLFVVTFLVPIAVMVPVVIVFEPAAVSVPVTRVKLLSIVARSNPMGARIGRASPVSFVPFIVVAYGIPIPVYPCEIRAWASRYHANHARTRRRADSDANRNLCW
jgi:hypothetical protein